MAQSQQQQTTVLQGEIIPPGQKTQAGKLQEAMQLKALDLRTMQDRAMMALILGGRMRY